MKEQTRNTEVQINEEEIGKLPEKEVRIMVIKIIKEEELRWWRSRTGEHFLPHKFIKRTFKRQVNSTKQLLNAGRGHQAPRKATQVFERR